MNEESFIFYEEQATLENKAWEQLEREILNGWVGSEVQLSARYDRIGKFYREMKNKIPEDRVNA